MSEDNVVYDDEHDDVLHIVYANEIVNTLRSSVCVTIDAVYMYDCIPEGRGNSSQIRESDGIR